MYRCHGFHLEHAKGDSVSILAKRRTFGLGIGWEEISHNRNMFGIGLGIGFGWGFGFGIGIGIGIDKGIGFGAAEAAAI